MSAFTSTFISRLRDLFLLLVSFITTCTSKKELALRTEQFYDNSGGGFGVAETFTPDDGFNYRYIQFWWEDPLFVGKLQLLAVIDGEEIILVPETPFGRFRISGDMARKVESLEIGVPPGESYAGPVMAFFVMEEIK